MSDELVLYTNPMSRGRIARWMLEETGRPYRAEIVAFGPPMKQGPYRTVNPMGKVPALVHRGVVVTEVAAILCYLAHAFPGCKLAPSTDDPQRGSYYRWMVFAAGALEYAVVNRSFGFEVPAEGRGRIGYGSYDDVMATLESAVSASEYLAGNRFSAADLYVGAALGWGMFTGSIDKRPAFEAYVDRFRSRPAAIRAQEIDDALLKTQQT